MEITNPNAFRLLKAQAQVQALQPRFILNEQQNQQSAKNKVLEISELFKSQKEEQGMQLLKALL